MQTVRVREDEPVGGRAATLLTALTLAACAAVAGHSRRRGRVETVGRGRGKGRGGRHAAGLRDVPRALAGGEGAIGADGGASSSFAGRTGDGLVALELETAAFCARYRTSCALEFLLLGLHRALLGLAAVLAGSAGGRHEEGCCVGVGGEELLEGAARGSGGWSRTSSGDREIAGRARHGSRTERASALPVSVHINVLSPTADPPTLLPISGPRRPISGTRPSSFSHASTSLRSLPLQVAVRLSLIAPSGTERLQTSQRGTGVEPFDYAIHGQPGYLDYT